MKLDDLVDVTAFEASLKNENKHIFSRWADTAREADGIYSQGKSYSQIKIIFKAYDEMHPEELREDKIISFIESLLGVIASEDAQRALIQAEVPPTYWKK